MALYKVEWKRSAVKELRALPKGIVEKILKASEHRLVYQVQEKKSGYSLAGIIIDRKATASEIC